MSPPAGLEGGANTSTSQRIKGRGKGGGGGSEINQTLLTVFIGGGKGRGGEGGDDSS